MSRSEVIKRSVGLFNSQHHYTTSQHNLNYLVKAGMNTQVSKTDIKSLKEVDCSGVCE